ncbi:MULTISPECIES: hypothetical protein [unclassified Cyanobium]|uniref:hypothetical protein n=1 Tax=unclassified Cyanobium TaxID=2627006 RepID=UPI0020CF823D|nr:MULTISPECIES: hypothetical protein [unclassified Cyanobium]MCP9860695.1 hypothetical protein [Cyanobium sp. Cruz-8H5]MCP9867931.1 hypothetical protein [Cyanobium sp. Cruz-8D1]
MNSRIQVFIGCDQQQREAALVLAHSLRRRSSLPITITFLEQPQLERAGLYWREWDPLQSTDFSFSRFLVPALLDYRGWGIYLDGDMLCLEDPARLWALRHNTYSLMCVQHPGRAWGHLKMGGLPQSHYSRKNWSSLMLFNASRCSRLTPDFVNRASGLDLHCFTWLEGAEAEPGPLPRNWNHLVDLDAPVSLQQLPSLAHWTLGGPWLPGFATAGGCLADLWRLERQALERQLGVG